MTVVAILGRPNVGKSTLFNALVKKDLSLTSEKPGTTRDYITCEVSWEGHLITLVDTGGLGQNPKCDLDAAVYREAQIAASTADIVLWVLDGRVGLTPLDIELACWLRRHARQVLHVVNKIDTPKLEALSADFTKLGAPELLLVSAEHRRGLENLRKKIITLLPHPKINKPTLDSLTELLPTVRITLVGRPNVGKSTMTNLFLGSSRTIVNPQPGTTRDAVETPLPHSSLVPKMKTILVDTAGMRARHSISDSLELRACSRTAHAINCSTIVLHLIDAVSGVTTQDKKIAGLIQKAAKASIIVINKWDLVEKTQPDKRHTQFRKEYCTAVREALFFQSHCPIVFMSAATGQGLSDLKSSILQVAENLQTPIPTGHLNRVIQKFCKSFPPPLRGKDRFKIFYATALRGFARQRDLELDTTSKDEATKSVMTDQRFYGDNSLTPPQIVAFCNNRRLLDPHWLNALEKKIRAEFPLQGVPVLWLWRDTN